MYIKHLVILAAGLVLVLIFVSSNIGITYNNKNQINFIINTISGYRDAIIITVSSVMLLSIFIKFATIDFEKCLKFTPYTCW
jgi:hypothetical protein